MMCRTLSEIEERRLVDPDGQLPERFWSMMETKVHAAYEIFQNKLQEEMERLCEGGQARQFSAPHGCIDRSYGSYVQARIGTAISDPQYHCGTHNAIKLSDYIPFLNQHGLWPFKACQARALRDI
ncbi:hypothetical protein BLS_006422 [Venturia inaequalis]|nr:hypothetical protein BLS_006422 [Venturia inaequalis]KAE9969064.1 hypothetical protein EG328_007121 [Venturia inaequalis]RDI89015.1 hypothetical protein Vi05172_g1023 [Venturia inaequalis]